MLLNMENKITFPAVLASCMKSEGLTQHQLAEKIGVNQSAICKWLSGRSEPTIENLWKLADFFGITIDILVGRHEY